MKDVSTVGFNVKIISFGLLAALTVTDLQAEEWSAMSGEDYPKKICFRGNRFH